MAKIFVPAVSAESSAESTPTSRYLSPLIARPAAKLQHRRPGSRRRHNETSVLEAFHDISRPWIVSDVLFSMHRPWPVMIAGLVPVCGHVPVCGNVLLFGSFLQSTCAARAVHRPLEGRSASKVEGNCVHRRSRDALQGIRRPISVEGGLQKCILRWQEGTVFLHSELRLGNVPTDCAMALTCPASPATFQQPVLAEVSGLIISTRWTASI